MPSSHVWASQQDVLCDQRVAPQYRINAVVASSLNWQKQEAQFATPVNFEPGAASNEEIEVDIIAAILDAELSAVTIRPRINSS